MIRDKDLQLAQETSRIKNEKLKEAVLNSANES
jgi:hypothetical protein